MKKITKLTPLIVFTLAAGVVSVGYIMALAILAPEQLAEATTAATDLICDKCVGTTDIADSAVTSAKIGSGQVKNSDIGNNAVTSGKIADGQVFGSDIASLTIGSSDLADSAVTSSKLAGGAVKPNVHIVTGSITTIAPGNVGGASVGCPAGEILTGGGFSGGSSVLASNSYPRYADRWYVLGYNDGDVDAPMRAWALCIGVFP